MIQGVRRDEIDSVVADASAAMPGPNPGKTPEARERMRVIEGRVTVMYGEPCFTIYDHAWTIAQQISRVHRVPWLELRVQKSDHWDFTLYDAGERVCDFSTDVSYYDDPPDGPGPWKLGDIATFVEVWGTPWQIADAYLVDWRELDEPQRAFPDDVSTTHDFLQLFDFMRRLGAPQPGPDTVSREFPLKRWEWRSR